MSGGGYRASLFHLGSLDRLAELEALDRVAHISSVSGGSITAGLLAVDPAPPGKIPRLPLGRERFHAYTG
jgi:predicted acylesterase/phospholipase RssA